MKKSLLVIALGLVAGAALAEETGRVISSVPVIQQVAVNRQVCSPQQVVTQPAQPSGGGAILGAVVGGLLGHTVGGGSGKAAATAVGVVAGAGVGNSLEARGQPQVATTQACSVQTTYENRTVGYNVTYEYAGKQYQVQMPYDPGPTIRLNITPISSNAPGLAMPPVASADVTVPTIIQPAVTVMPAPVVYYPAYYAPYYYRPYYPPVSLSIGYWHGGGWGHHHHHWH